MPDFFLTSIPAAKQQVLCTVHVQSPCPPCALLSAWCWQTTGTQTLWNGHASPHLPQLCPLDLGSARWPPSTDLPCFLMKGRLWKAAQVTYTQLALQSHEAGNEAREEHKHKMVSTLPRFQVLLLSKFSYSIQKNYFSFEETGKWFLVKKNLLKNSLHKLYSFYVVALHSDNQDSEYKNLFENYKTQG